METSAISFRVLLHEGEFENVLPNSEGRATGELHSPTQQPEPPRALLPATQETKTLAYGKNPGEPSPFIAFMLEATAALNLVKGRFPNGSRIQPDKIRDWLKANWRAELGTPSHSKIEAMATLIRHPDDGKGGLYGRHNSRVMTESSEVKRPAASEA
jgi:hypothetical protein